MKKLFTTLLAAGLHTAALGQSVPADITVNASAARTQISRHIYGQFSEHLGRCIYDGFWVSENSRIPNQGRIRLDIVAALRKIHIPNLRWPGGCFADEYHWRDGIGPRPQRPEMINTNWGNVAEDNSFGTHEFLQLCDLLHTTPYISGNVGSGTVEEMSKWVEYLNFDGQSPMTALRAQNGHPQPWNVPFWGIGNENWGCGGNMKADFYADVYNRYASFAKSYPNAELKRIACGPNVDDYNWTETVMRDVSSKRMWGLSLHYYVFPRDRTDPQREDRGSATQFEELEYAASMRKTLRMDELLTRHSTIMDKYDPDKKVALVVDEWGVWTVAEPGTNPRFLFQQNSLRDALLAATTLNIFNNHAERVRLANLAQAVNVLQALILTDKDKLLLTPTYHVFDLYQVHQDATLLPLVLHSPDYVAGREKMPALNASASRDSLGVVHLSLVNLDAHRRLKTTLALPGVAWKSVSGQLITSPKFNDYNTFEQPSKIKPVAFNGAKKEKDNLLVELPPLSVVVLTLKK